MSSNEPTSILIIDSDNVRRGMLACTLPPSRYTLDFAKAAEAGLDRLLHSPPALVLIGHDAGTRDLCQHIRSLPTARDCVVVLMDESFHDEATGVAETEASGADIALPFPFTLDELEERLDRYGRRPPGTLPSATPSPSVQVVLQAEPDPEPPAEPTPEQQQAAWDAFRQRVESLHRQLDELDYYALLGVSRQSSSAQIKDAYFDRSIDFHPDRFLQLDDEPLRQKTYEIFKRATEAFKVLLDTDARSEYDRQLAGVGSQRLRYLEFGRTREAAPVGEELATTPAGRKYVNFAELAERNGNLKSARMYLTLAMQCEPRNGALRERLEAITGKLSR